MPSRSLLTRKEEKLFHYIKRGNYDRFTKLVSEKANFDILSIVKKYSSTIYYRYGNTLLHYCCKYNSSAILLYLLKRVNNIDIKNNKGETPLQIAAKYKNAELCKILLSKGSNYLLRNSSGKCAIDYGLEDLIDLSPFLSKNDNSSKDNNIFIYDSDEEMEYEDSDWYFEENYYDEYNRSSNKEEFKRKILSDWEEEMKRIEKEREMEKEIKEKEKARIYSEGRKKTEKMNIYKNIEKNNELRWLKFINSKPKYLKVENIPFPRGLGSDFDNILGINKEMNRKEIKRIIYANEIRWHPDKFERRFGELLNDKNRDEIMSKVKEISQIINKLKSEYLK